MLQLENITKKYTKENQTILALNGVTLKASEGEFVVVSGASGSGKTTLLLAAGGLLKPSSGKIQINSTDIYNLTQEERSVFRANNIGFVFQQYHLIPYLTIIENVKVPMLANKSNISDKEVIELIDSLGLKDRLHHIPAELSAGEKQRTALARALLFKPKILLADEITGNLDPENIEIVMNRLADFKNSGGTILLVTHDKEVSKKADRIVYLEKGEILRS
ncbi:MAG: ABC transporter ATP-binding protein [Prolixibacteraceae bacterium]|jgi:putative ABC transport system ATP-binding protein|nr:ABC transporter ATP-binding protein [Prolixibacteraceae bacterium]MBT6006743.1 ABC transporter ATP-binding protein [Prolixibacteraceae bacterium]MBT6764467.1 ABC transporter ATP-binding protein [Prolixibacteraceae bacterium]MBT6999201.1 ABC transporter ATP-binding protein [Prolixibacteraceae bacterium]MBT7393316.1 ABC transporter ATP-binding protein [Prolixibacteraceae bacterium]